MVKRSFWLNTKYEPISQSENTDENLKTLSLALKKELMKTLLNTEKFVKTLLELGLRYASARACLLIVGNHVCVHASG